MPSRLHRPPLRAALLLPLALTLLFGVFTAQAEAIDRYRDPVVVGMGDSYASGEGAGAYLDANATAPQSQKCHQSMRSWVASSRVLNGAPASASRNFSFAACSGATAKSIIENNGRGTGQMDELRKDTDYVFLSIGGNDIGFGGISTACIVGVRDCDRYKDADVGDGEKLLRPLVETAPPFVYRRGKERVTALLEQIQRRAPYARVYLAGYPDLFSGNKSVCLSLSSNERRMLSNLPQVLMRAQREAASAMRKRGLDVNYIETIGPFGTRGACASADQLIKYPAAPPEVLHPNAKGYQVYTDTVSQLSGRPERDIAGVRVRDRILDRYMELDGPYGQIGLPTRNELTGLRDGGAMQRFTNASMYWSKATGARFVRGSILRRYGEQKWETGPLGYPTTDVRCGIKDGGCYQHYQGGSIFYTRKTGGRVVSGRIRDRWSSMGWERSYLGYPIEEQRNNFGGPGIQCQSFQGGIIISRPGDNWIKDVRRVRCDTWTG